MKDFKEILLEKLKVSGNINNYDYKTDYWDKYAFERMITFIIYDDKVTDSFFKNNPEEKIPESYLAFYSEDEEIPYKTRLLPEWNPDDIPFFVRKHRHDYKELLDKYDISASTGVNLFINYRTKPSVALIAKACADVNPEEFFTLGDANEDGKFYPERGDIVSISGKTMLVLTKEKSNRETHSFTGVCIQNNEVDLNTLETITYSRINPEFIKKASGELVSDTLKKIRLLFK